MSDTATVTPNLEDLKAKAVESLGSAPPPAEEKNTFSFADLYENKDEVQEYLVKGLIPAKELFGIFGEDGIGKTQLTTQLCLSIAMKRTHFLGLDLNIKCGNSLVVATEDGKKKFTNSLMKIAHGLNPDLVPAEVGIRFTQGSNFGTFDELIAEIEKCLIAIPSDLIIVDALLDCFAMADKEINSNSDANQVLKPLANICVKYDTTICFIHHAGKTAVSTKHKEGKIFLEKSDSLGAGRLTSKARTLFALSNDHTQNTEDEDDNPTHYVNYLHVVKSNTVDRFYFRNAMKLNFNTTNLLHEFDSWTNIKKHENPNAEEPAEKQAASIKKPMPSEIPVVDHELNVERAFAEKPMMNRKDLVDKLKKYYNVGQNKIEESNGYLPHLLHLGLIIKSGDLFRKADKKEFKLTPSTQFEMDITPEISDEEAPF